jgi:hypothetical protein
MTDGFCCPAVFSALHPKNGDVALVRALTAVLLFLCSCPWMLISQRQYFRPQTTPPAPSPPPPTSDNYLFPLLFFTFFFLSTKNDSGYYCIHSPLLIC